MQGEIELTEVQKNKKRLSIMLVWACFFLYVLMMGSKNAYTAEVVTLQGVFNKSKAEVSLAMTYYFVTYAIMQFLLSVFMGKINLKIYLTLTALASSVLTVLIAFMPSIKAIYALCAVNGILQAGIYSGCMAVISKYLSKKLLPFANRVMTTGSAVAGAISYGVPALFVSMGRWDLPFVVLGVLFFCAVIFFFYVLHRISKFPPELSERNVKTSMVETEQPLFNLKGLKGVIGYFSLMMVITFISNIMHYATLNWMPDMLHSVFNMPQEYSILITLLAPLAMLVGPMFTISLCEKHKNIMKISLFFAIFALLMIVPLIFFYDVNIVLSITLLVLFISIANGARAVFGGVLAFKMRSRINSGEYLAATNAMASIAAGVIPPIAGNIIDSKPGIAGYGTLYLCVSLVSILFVILLAVITLILQANIKKQSEGK